MKNHILFFVIFYRVPWIVRWDLVVIGTNYGAGGISFPILNRRIAAKWWDKYDFFANGSIFPTK